MKRELLDILVNITSFVQKNWRIRPDVTKKVKLNLGAGLTVTPGWTNIDASLNALISSWPGFVHHVLHKASGARQNYSFQEYHTILKNNQFVYHNLIFGIPFVDNCADFIYCSHLLEHLTRQQGNNLVKEIYRVLKKGGILRVVVPNLSTAVNLYFSGEKDKALKLFYDGTDAGNEFSRHKWMYDFETLRSLLQDNGFKNTECCEYQRGKMPDIHVLDNRPETSLYVEAVKG